MFENKALSTIFVETEKKIINFQNHSLFTLFLLRKNFDEICSTWNPKLTAYLQFFTNNLKQ